MQQVDKLKRLLAKINPDTPRFPGIVPLLFVLNASRLTRLLRGAVKEFEASAYESKFVSILAETALTSTPGRTDLPSLHSDTLKHWTNVLESEEPHEHAFQYFRKLNDQNVTFLDIGANTGVSALSIYKVAPSWPTISIEMLPILEPMLKLTRNYFTNYSHPFEYLIYGLGNINAEIEVTIPVVDGHYIHTMASLSSDQFTKEYIITHLNSLSCNGVWNRAVQTFPLPVKRLDDVHLPNVTDLVFVKIDAEGQEVAVLGGMRKFIDTHRPGLLIETDSPESVLAELGERGYRKHFYHYDPTAGRLLPGGGKVSQGNYFFFPATSPLFVDS